MYISQLELNTRDRSVRKDLADCQRMHCSLLRAFPKAPDPARQEFGVLYRIEIDGNGATALVQSQARPDWSELPESYLAQPARWKELNGSYAAVSAGSRLRFRLLANPTKRLGKSAGDAQGRRVELQTDEEQLAWLQRKGEMGGFEPIWVQASPGIGAAPGPRAPAVQAVEAEKVTGERSQANREAERGGRDSGVKLTGRRPGEDGDKTMTFGSVRFDGELQVTDADRFRQSLERGIGSGKAYGFGLLSIAPPERQ